MPKLLVFRRVSRATSLGTLSVVLDDHSPSALFGAAGVGTARSGGRWPRSGRWRLAPRRQAARPVRRGRCTEVLDEGGKPIAPFTADNCEPIRADSTRAAIKGSSCGPIGDERPAGTVSFSADER